MKNSKKLTAKQELFCLYFVQSRDMRGAAAKAGWTVSPERAAMKLLSSPAVAKRIEALELERNATLAEVTEGYRRLAFGSVADAVRLMLSDEAPDMQQLEKLDLAMVSDIKRPKGGGLEIKFFDRLKALDRLSELGQLRSGESSDFISALNSSAKALSTDGEGRG